MSAGRLFLVALLALAVVLAWRWEGEALTHPPGVLVREAPRQTGAAGGPFEFDGHRLVPRAGFDLRARVLARQRYWLDRGAALAPVDLALGWGPMSDQAVLDRIDVRQGGRWYHLRWPLPPPIAESAIMRHSANMHIIPASPAVARTIRSLRPGELVRLRGALVDVEAPDGWQWRTSLSREDTGDGSCELFYVEQAVPEPGG